MIILNILVQPAILWVIMLFIFGHSSVPSFRPLILTFVLISIITTLISVAIGLIAIIPNFIIFAATLSLFYKLDIKQTLLSVGIFEVVMFIIALICNSLY